MVPFSWWRNSARLALLLSVNAALAQETNDEAPFESPPPTPPADSARSSQQQDERAFAVWLGQAESDNLERVLNGPRGAYTSVGVLLDLSRASTRIDSGISTDMELREYSEDGIDSEPIGTLDARARINIVPDRFNWRFDEHFGQGLSNAFAAPGPNNRETINVFSTGPELDLSVGARTDLSLRGDFSRRRYDDSESLDSDSVIYELGLFRQRDRTTRFGIAANTNRVDYDVNNVAPYDIDGLSVRYDKTFATGGVSATIGTNELTLLDETRDEPLLNFEWRRALATRSTLSVAASRSFSDSGRTLGLTVEEAPVGSNNDMLISSSPFEQKRVEVAYSLRGTRTEILFGLGTADEKYFSEAVLDNENRTVRASFLRTISPRLSVGATIDRIARDFDDTSLFGDKEEDRTFRAWANRSLSRTFDLGLVLTRYERHGSQSFDENRYEVRFSYSPSNSASAALGSARR